MGVAARQGGGGSRVMVKLTRQPWGVMLVSMWQSGPQQSFAVTQSQLSVSITFNSSVRGTRPNVGDSRNVLICTQGEGK